MISDNWKQEAISRFPEFSEDYREMWETPYLCWIDIRMLFEKAYRPPRNEDLIKRIYEYYFWCLGQPRGEKAEDDLLTCVTVCFFEHIPETREAMEDMPRWFSREAIASMEQTLSYQIGEAGYRRILDAYESA